MASNFWSEVWRDFQTGALHAAQAAQGKRAAHEWLNYKPAKAASSIQASVQEAVRQQHGAFLDGAVEQLLHEIRVSLNKSDQDDANELLWLLKTLIYAELQSSGYLGGEE